MNQLLQHFHAWKQRRVLVLGDLMLDRYTWGDAERVSPEAPVLVLRTETEEVRLGGAASAATLLRGLGAEVAVVGVVGDDTSGRVVARLLREQGIDDRLVLSEESRRTTTKERFLGRTMSRHAHQILRVDSEDCHALRSDLVTQLKDRLSAELSSYDAVLVSDYAKGVCTRALVSWIIDAAKGHGVPTLVDPGRGVDYEQYRGATIIKPNRLEAQEASGITICTPSDALDAGHKLCSQFDTAALIVTLDCDGIAACLSNGEGELCSAEVRVVCDITGAGDMVAAMVSLCLANGLPVVDAVQLANIAAGLEVEQLGVVPIELPQIRARLQIAHSDVENPHSTVPAAKPIVSLDEAIALAASYRAQGKRIVFTNGCFDLLHVGHVGYLQEAARLGDVLIVAVNSDAGVRRLKGPDRPVIGERDRAAMLASLACVDHVLIFDDDTPHELLRQLRPDVLVKGGTTAEVIGREVVEAYGGRVCTTAAAVGTSTTDLITRLARITNQALLGDR